MDVRVFRYTKWDLERRARFWFVGHILNPPLNLTDVLDIVVELGPVVRSDVFLETRKLVGYRVEDAAVALSVRQPLSRASTVAEQALEGHTRIHFCRKRRRGRRPRHRI